MARHSVIATLGLLCAVGLACAGEEGRTVLRRPNVPQFAPAESVVLRIPDAQARGVLRGVSRLNDSTIAVVTDAPGGVALVAMSGVPRRTPSLEGMGGERVAHVAPCTQGGLVLITQGDRRTISLSASGTASAASRIPATLGTVLGVQCESAHDLVALVDGNVPETRTAALVRVGAALVRVSGNGRVDTLGAFPGRELLRLSATDSGTEPPFAVVTRFAAGPTRLYLANTNESTIQELQTNGRRLATFDVVRDRKRVSRNQVDSALIAAYGGRLAVLPPEARGALVDAMSKERTLPLWKSMVVDPDENLWATSHEPPDSDGDRVWMVYGKDGTRRARIFLPHDFEVTEVGRDYVLGFYQSAPPDAAARRYGLQLLGSR